MTAHIQPARSAPEAAREHPLSWHPIIRAVVKAGPAKLWTAKDLQELLGLSERGAQILLAEGLPSTIAFPVSGRGQRGRCQRLKVTSGGLLLYLLQNSREVPQSEVLAALGIILDQVSTPVLSQLVTHLQRVIQRRASRAVVVVSDAPSPAPAAGAQMDLFPSL